MLKKFFKTMMIDEILSALKNKKNAINQAGIMVGARVLGIVFGGLGAVWAARCLGPHNMGISGMVQSIVAQAVLVLSVIYDTVLVREYKNAHTDKDKNHLIRVTATFRLVGAGVFCLFGGMAMSFHLIPHEYHLAGWFFIPLVLIGTVQPAWVFQAAEKQHFQSSIAVLQPTLKAVLYFSLFRRGVSAWADLAIVSMVTIVVTVIYWSAIYRLTPMKGQIIDFCVLKDAWKFIVKSRWLFISAVAIYIYTTLEQPLLGWLYSLEALGKYRTAITVTNVASSFFSMVPLLLYPRFLEWRKRGVEVLWRRQIKLAIVFGVVGISLGSLGFFLIPFFYPYVFGLPFLQAATPCAILIMSKIFATLGGIFYWGLVTHSSFDKTSSLFTIGLALFSLLCNLMFIPKWGMYGAATVDLATEVIGFVIIVWIAKNRMVLFSKN